MKLCAIFICWDDWDILKLAIDSISSQVDGVIVIGSVESSSGEVSIIPEEFYDNPYFDLFLKAPDLTRSRRDNETIKRNLGLEKAREEGYTHFLMLDADEFYHDFTEDKKLFDDPDLLGLVCDTVLYFRPTLCFDDVTRVPFIHRLTSDIRCEKNYYYPFSVNDKDNPCIDPTRTMNLTEGIRMSQVKMHHMSFIRADIKKKIRNSAGLRLKTFEAVLLNDYREAKEGYRLAYNGKILRRVENLFNLPEIVDSSLLSTPAQVRTGG